MSQRFYPILEKPLPMPVEPEPDGSALGRVVERHPAFARLFDFYYADPIQVAREVGMVSDAEDEDDLASLDFGPPEWYEAAAGLSAVHSVLAALQSQPNVIREALYDPALRPEHVIADLETIAQTLEAAAQQEIRFHFVLDSSPPHP